MPITIQTDKPVAYDSPDHLFPFGTANDNSTDPIFNRALFSLIPAPDVRLLDIGCSGGGFVKSILDAGGLAVGIEGSDYSQKRRRAEWATIPGSLFTADATAPFQLSEEGRPLRFNVITAWECLEHIADGGLDGLFENIHRHLAPQGIVLVSVCPFSCLHTGARTGEGVELHQTAQSEEWWRDRLAGAGFVLFDDLKSCFTNYVRGWPHEPDSPVLIFTTPQARQVPKTFHQVWLGGSPLPPDALAYQRGWRQHHPDWEWRLWTEADLGQFESQWALDHAAHLSQKSDVIRYEVLRRFGGVYLDTDVECRRSIEPLLKNVTAFAGRERGEVLCGAVLGGIAGHPLFDALVRGLPESMRAYAQCYEQAGPHYLSRVAYKIPEVTVFPPDVFYPYAWDETHRQGEDFAGAYAVHHWRGSWNPSAASRQTPPPPALSRPEGTESGRATEALCWNGQSLAAYPPGRHAQFQHAPAKVSVCLPASGGPGPLRRSLGSALAQAGDHRVVLVTDSREAFAAGAEAADAHPNVIVYQAQDSGEASDALNLCADWAAGDYLQFLGSGDTLHPGCLARHAAALDRYEHVVLSRVGAEARLRSGAVVFRPMFERTLHLPAESALAFALTSADPLTPLAPLMIRRSALTRRGLRFAPGLGRAAGYDLVLRLLGDGDLAYSHQPGCVVEEAAALPRSAAERQQHFLALCRSLQGAVQRTTFAPEALQGMADQIAGAYQSLLQGGLGGQTLGQILAGAHGGTSDAATAALLGLLEDVRRSLTTGQRPAPPAA